MTPDMRFRVAVKVERRPGGVLGYCVRIFAKRGEVWDVVGILELNPDEWASFKLVAEISSIQVIDVPV